MLVRRDQAAHLEATRDPQVVHRGIVQTYRHATAGDVKVIGPVAR